MEPAITWQKFPENEHPNKLTTYISSSLPDIDPLLFFGAFVFAFDKEKKIIMTKLKKRGWDIPGGKIEKTDRNSSEVSTIDLLVNTAVRETLEETKVKIKNVQLVAYRHIFNANPKLPDSKFPHPDSYMCYFYAEIDDILEFKAEEQDTGAIDRGFFEKEEALKMETIYLKHPTIFDHIINNFK